jgi:hypothetical protein
MAFSLYADAVFRLPLPIGYSGERRTRDRRSRVLVASEIFGRAEELLRLRELVTPPLGKAALPAQAPWEARSEGMRALAAAGRES